MPTDLPSHRLAASLVELMAREETLIAKKSRVEDQLDSFRRSYALLTERFDTFRQKVGQRQRVVEETEDEYPELRRFRASVELHQSTEAFLQNAIDFMESELARKRKELSDLQLSSRAVMVRAICQGQGYKKRESTTSDSAS